MDFLGPKDTYIRIKCRRCGYEENIPDWVYGEFKGEDIASKKDEKETVVACLKYIQEMFKKK